MARIDKEATRLYMMEYRKTDAGKAAHQRGKVKYYNTPRGDFSRNKVRAKRRGIPFLLTFEQWWSIWEAHWMPDKGNKLHLMRKGDQGAYEIGNVRVGTLQDNRAEQVMVRDTITGRFLA